MNKLLNIIKEWHNGGYTGKGITVGDVSKTPYFKESTLDPFDRVINSHRKTHGYWTTKTILDIAPKCKVALLPYGIYGEGLFYNALDYCRENDVKVFNVSYGGTRVDAEVHKKIKEKMGNTILTTSAGNHGGPLEDFAASDLFLAVGSYQRDSATGAPLNINPIIHMDGTSFSSPIVAGLIAILNQYFGKNVNLYKDDIVFLLSDGKGGVEMPKFREKLVDLEGHWAEKEIQMLYLKGIINGYEDGTFKPDEIITRAEVAKIVANLMTKFI